ncbi:hypothetical protein [Bradyrhizobium sp. 143]|uniref:hypothetical protein n=1 Tax=Bradyrhizobium sp. 143 TaxID=2782619 RepID=UPI001FF87D4D|nr:hypothetical protein [Bradyrhizobium sp. 143]
MARKSSDITRAAPSIFSAAERDLGIKIFDRKPNGSSLWAGEDPKAILDRLAQQFDAITEKVGIDNQKAVYKVWAAKPGAYPQ